MFGESLLELFKLGGISRVFKQHCSRSVASFVISDQETYEFVGDNPDIYIRETNYVSNITLIANNPNVCASDSALEMDLLGRVTADSAGLSIFSGVSEQVDFSRWSSSSENGKLIICFVVVLYRVSACIPAICCLRDTISMCQLQYLWFGCSFFFCFSTFSVLLFVV